ncbi:hypothetical protein [Nocardia aurantia]|uniref:Uncharacterized protein n=1 Tax=Nocardia aurantia TaxID=2585199 RepID=A0A7K0DGM6_9NOCA|nr:hypothetical protein [Nocardia aurantia]MQY24963.1 hypothetical protein [Nocardia aurantia]
MTDNAGTHDLVIARYNEPLDWVLRVPENFRLHIYNKGGPDLPMEILERATTYLPLRNAGRESDTYLTHMLEYGPGAGEYTVFAQGDPFEHSPDFLALLDRADTWSDVQGLSWAWKEHIGHPPSTLLTPERSQVPGLRVREELYSLCTWTTLEWVDPGSERIGRTYRLLHRLPEGVNMMAHFLSMCELPDLADECAKHLIGRHCYGAIFAVRNPLIAKLPQRALVRMRQAAIGADAHGYFCERLWLHVFGEPFLFPAPVGGPVIPEY